MQNHLRRLLLRMLGVERYLMVISRIFLALVLAGRAKGFPELHYVTQLVKPGWTCIDIGANLGYYSVILSRAVGPRGSVYAVEPVPAFLSVLKANLRKLARPNVKLLPFALGDAERRITMGTPNVGGVFRHGLTAVAEGDAEYAATYEVEMRVPDEVFAGLSSLHYVKCDVEGFEAALLPKFMQTIKKHRPIIQIEIAMPDNRRKIMELLSGEGYVPHGLIEGGLVPLRRDAYSTYAGGDFYFLIDDAAINRN